MPSVVSHVSNATAVRGAAAQTSLRAARLAQRLEAGALALASFAATLTEKEWAMPIPKDGRSIGVVVHHVASVYPLEIQLAQAVARGDAITGVTMDDVHRMNAMHHPAFAAAVREISDLYTRPLKADEMVLCVDEKTGLQPRPRKSPTLAARPERPVRVEHEYRRCGALNLFAAFDTRTGKVYGRTAERKRQVEFIAFLEQLDREVPASITTIHVVLDNLRMHKGKQVQAWLAKHPRFVFHHPPVHCSWMNQVEQWFSILQRKRLRIADFADKAALAERLRAYIREWDQVAHPFNWSSKSVAKVMAKCEMSESPTEGRQSAAA